MPIDAKFTAEPLQTIDGHFPKQPIGIVKAWGKFPSYYVFKLLKVDTPQAALFMNH